MSTRILLLCCLFGGVGLTIVSRPTATPTFCAERNYALFFAVDDYERMDYLENSIKNARVITAELRDDFGFQIKIVANPTFDDIDLPPWQSSVLARSTERAGLVWFDNQSKRYDSTRVSSDGFIRVEGGTFTMGCQTDRDTDCGEHEQPAHEVTVSTFYLSPYEVTQAEWRSVMGGDPLKLYNKGCDDCPVEGVDWSDIQAFLQKINSKGNIVYRLPTEAEWEYAARGGNQSKYYLYSGSDNIEEVAWYINNAVHGNTHGTSKTTRPVGTKKPNELGFYDMSGNVWEWCNDWYDKYYYKKSPRNDPKGGVSGTFRVLRGGGWLSGSRYCLVAHRNITGPESGSDYNGFRLARSF